MKIGYHTLQLDLDLARTRRQKRASIFDMLRGKLSILLLASTAGASFVRRGGLETLSGPLGPPCARASFSNPRWEIQDFSYIAPDRAINDTTPFLSFVLVNEAYGSWVTCDATRQDVDYASRHSMHALNCHMPQTFFWFDAESGSLSIQQTWGCSDVKPRKYVSLSLCVRRLELTGD